MLFIKSLSEEIYNKPKEKYPKEFAKRLYNKKVLNKSEYKAVNINLSNYNLEEVAFIIHKMNQDLEKAAEKFYL